MRHPLILLVLVSSIFGESWAETTRTAVKSLREPALQNVELTRSARLNGQVIDNSGIPVAALPIRLKCGTHNITVTTDSAGRFSVEDLKGGTCYFQIDKRLFACRIWRHGTAPPKSLSSIALVNDDSPSVRGNRFARNNACPPCEQTRCLSSKAKYGLAIGALGATAAYVALSRENVSE